MIRIDKSSYCKVKVYIKFVENPDDWIDLLLKIANFLLKYRKLFK